MFFDILYKLFESPIFITVISTLIATLVATLIIYLIKQTTKKYKIKKAMKMENYEFVWKPLSPLINNSKNIKKITDYKKTWKMNITEAGFDIDITSDLIHGYEAFEQGLIKLLNTERDKYEIYRDSSYGVSYILTDSLNQEDFESKSIVVANEILEIEKDWIKEIFSIKKIKNKNELEILLGLRGVNDIVTINIFMFNYKE